MGESPQVLVVGAGPTGLVMALMLARLGVRFRIVDKSSRPGETSRAMAVAARTLEFYRQLGFADDVVRAGLKMETWHAYEGGREIASFDLGDIGRGVSPFPFVLSFPQDDHERLLTAQLERLGVPVEWHTELTEFTDAGDHVQGTQHRRPSLDWDRARGPRVGREPDVRGRAVHG